MLPLIARYLRPYRLQVAVVLVLLLIQAIANLYLPDLNAEIINKGVATGDTDFILRTGGLMLLVTAALAVTTVIAVYLAARVSMGFGRDVRSAIFRQVQAFGQTETGRFGTASLITRNTNDVLQVQTVIFMALTVMVAAPILAIGGVIMALRQDVPLSGLLVVVLPLMATVIAVVMRRAIPLFQAVQRKLDTINLVTREALAGVRVIRAFVRTDHEEARFDAANTDLFATQLQVNRIFAIVIPTMTAILNLSSVAVMWFGGHRVEDGGLPIGNLTAFLTYLFQILMSVLMAVFMFVMVPRAAVSAGRIQEVLQTDPTIHDPEHPVTEGPPAVRGTVEFRDVEFRYPGAEHAVLRGVSFTALAGQTTAIVGSTGSGKSTLISLVPRFHDPSAGSVLVDGIDVRQMARPDLWHRLGVVPQKAFLFSGTVASNLRYGDEEADEPALWRALEIAQGREFVEAMDGGLEAPITQGGSNVSGGQRQRLAIARALVKRAVITIFDDSFSALDVGTDARLRAALHRELADATVIIVAQRVGTILHADRIVVMDEGLVVGIGTHAELLEACQTYREIVASQLTASEEASA